MNPRLNRTTESGQKDKSLLGQLTKGMSAKKVDGGTVYTRPAKTNALKRKTFDAKKDLSTFMHKHRNDKMK